MTLNEKQLADLFQHNSTEEVSADTAGDCLSATEASASRIQKAEQLANHSAAAQAMKLVLSLQEWSQQMARSIEQSRRSWFSQFGLNKSFKTAMVTMTLAVAFVVTVPNLVTDELSIEATATQSQHAAHQSDIISSNPFDSNGDVLTSSGFDSTTDSQDKLFDGSFG